VDKELLFKPPETVATEDVVAISDGEVLVRGLSRDEQLKAVKQDDVTADGMPRFERTAIIEARVVAAGMVDPAMTEAEVRQWQRVPGRAADVDAVSTRIQRLSGMVPQAAKEAYKSVRGESGAGVRVLPGAEAGHDGGRATEADAG
jgi:hypothetical protein